MKRKVLLARVLETHMHKTAIVKVERLTRHPFYGKVLKVVKKYKVHDEKNETRVGDRVLIEESRPLSRQKRWTVQKIVVGDAR